MKKVMNRLCMLLMLVSVLWFIGTDKSQVLAAESNSFFTEELNGIDITNDMAAPKPTTQGKENYIFAGYYAEAECETPVTASTDQTVYAKFVPSEVLSIKAQLKAETTAESSSTNLRLVSTVDSLNYKTVGFEIYYNNATTPIIVKTSTVYERIVASAESGVDYNYSPKVADTESEYFVTATLLNINKNNFDKGFYVKPYWKTLDGTTVYGEGKYLTVNNGLDATNINVPVKVSAALNEASLSVTVAGTAYPATVAYYDGTYAYINITVTNRDSVLKSLNAITVTDGTTSGTTEYRNLMTKYSGTGTEDTSWYDVATDTNKYVVATSADLYGIAKIANEGAANGTVDNFADKEIYVVADIAVNGETLITESMDANYTKWRSYANGEYTYATAPTYSWTPISEFAGKFYGEGHTISGLYSYLEANSQTNDFSIAFIRTTLETAELNDFKLLNSSFCNGGTNHYASVPTGSIVGTGTGKLNTIYSEALVDNGHGRTGGLVGCVIGDNFTMTNCWFNGVVTSRKGASQTRAGGLIGHLEGSNNKIDNCLNSGDVIVDITGAAKHVGGLIGIVLSSAGLDIQNTLNTGSIQITAGSTDCVGAILGIQNKAVLTNVYSTTSGEIEGNVSEDAIKGANAIAEDSVIKDFFTDGTWTTVNAHIPVLTSLKSAVIDDSWYNQDKDTFVLYDKADLYGFATLSQETDFAGKTVKLGADIEVIAGDSSSWEATESRNMWIPIGNSTVPFAGTFDGGLHTIRGVYFNAAQQGGLFSQTASTANVKNFSLENSYFKSTLEKTAANMGSIAGVAAGTFSGIYSDATVTGTYEDKGKIIGGLVGNAYKGFTLINSWFDGNVTSNMTEDARVGGLIGSASEAGNYMIYNCLNTGAVSVPNATGVKLYTGGLVGHVYSGGSISIVNALNTGVISYNTASGKVDALVGGTTGTVKLTNVYATNESCDLELSFGGTKVAASAITGSVASDELTGFDFDNVWQEVADATPILNFAQANQSFDTSWYNVASSEYVLYDKDDLYGFAALSKTMDFAGKTIKLGNDIVVHTGDASTWGTTEPENVRVWESIGNATTPFAGKFDGNSYTISGIYLNTDTAKGGFFGVTSSTAEIGNFRLTNSYFESTVDEANAQFGCIAGVGEGTFEKIYSDATVVAEGQNIGGMIGQSSGLTMKECWFDGSVESTMTSNIRIGGLVGFATNLGTTTIENCLNSGTVNGSKVSGTSARVGGLIGYVQSSGEVNINYCYNTGKVTYNTATAGYGAILGAAGDNSVVTIPATTHADGNSCGKNGITNANILRTNRSNRVGDAALTYMTGFDFENTWTTVLQNTPVLKTFVDVVCDTSWYVGHEDDSTYVLYDKADLLGFSTISQDYNFAGKTVKLGADIVVNPGEVSTWDTTALKYHWAPIGNNTNQFAGTFDGNLHTIQGLYIKTDSQYTGMFSVIGDGAVVRNLKLKNSYFESSGMDLGSIAGACKGTNLIDTVSSDAIVSGSYNRIGGLIGGGHGDTTVQYCCYEGTVTNTSTVKKYTGGIMGGLYDDASAVITNCLNTGVVDVHTYTEADTSIFAGGIVGATKNSGTNITITNCLMVGKVLVNENALPKHFSLLTGYYAGSKTLNNNYAVMPEDWTTDIQEAAYATKPTVVEKSDITGDTAKETLEGFDFYTVWSVRENDTPVLNMPRVTLDEYIVRDAADLKFIAALSQTNNFAGKTVKLAANIDLNNNVDNQWTPIGNSDVPFAGTFDGQGYTISNLYIETSTKYIGLFAETSPNAVVKHFIMDTATISSSTSGVGVVAGRGHGMFSDIKVTNAAITGGGRLGGLIGLAQNSVTLSNCSFEGTITCVGAEKENRYIGGLLGYITKGSLKISNCMNAGTVIGSAENALADSPGIGGIVGCVNGATSIEINSCLNAGTVKTDATVVIEGVGPIVGRLDAPGSGFEKYALEKNYTVPCTDLSGIDGVAQVAVDTIKNGAETAMPLLDWETQWESVDGDFPKVRFSQTGFVASASIDVEATSLSNLTTLYPTTRVLKQGDIHAHADNGASSDGTVSLTEWKTQLTNLDMDFASSLDHQSTLHINNSDWDKDLFLYGSEIGVAVKTSDGSSISIATPDGDKTFGVHQNLYFTNETDFKNVLNHSTFADAFDYLSYFSDATYYNGGNFKLGALRTSTWKEFIQTVQNNNGFYALAHPMLDPSYITVENMDTYLKPYLVDGMGLEVLYMGLGTTNVKNGYQIWKSVLEDGYRVYATAGTDTHKNLQTGFTTSDGLEFQEALTSFYAEKQTGETAWSEAYVRYLREGNFTAGSVGIQMSVGNTQMGGTGSFEDAYLEIGIGAFHRDAYDETHQYRVDVWRDNCVVYSQLINPTEEDTQMTAYLRTKADATCKFYRVTVYDVTTNTCIALSNPIWNSAY